MPKKSAKTSQPEEPMKLFYIFYNSERWDNWINRLNESNFEGVEGDEEMPEGYRVLYSFGMDITLSVLKIIKLYQNGRFSKEDTLERISTVESIILGKVPEGAITEIVESLQLSMLVLFAASKKFLEGGYRTEIKTLVKEGRSLIDGDSEKALEVASEIGASVIGGATCCGKYVKEDIDSPTLFDEWLIQCETMHEAMGSLKNFDEEPGETS